jgi:hypothetical protein
MLMNLFKFHKINNISQETKEIITGMLLSDGSLNMQKISKNARMQFHQKDESFIKHLYGKMKKDNLVSANYLKSSSFHKKTNKTYTAYRFDTLSLPYFTEIYPLWYTKINNKNIKIIPSNISELLTPRALAYFIMGDGYFFKETKTIGIATMSFSVTEVELIQNVLLNKYNILSNKHCKNLVKEQYVIYIKKESFPLLYKTVYPYFIESMHYKLGL